MLLDGNDQQFAIEHGPVEIVDLTVLGYTLQSFGMMDDYNIYMYLL